MRHVAPSRSSGWGRLEAGTQEFPGTIYQAGQLTEKRRQHRSFIVARAALAAAFIVMWAIFLPTSYMMPLGFAVALGAEEIVLALHMLGVSRATNARSMDLLHYSLLVSEICFHTVMVYYLGGVSWLGPTAYFFALMYGVVFLTRWQAAAFTAGIIGAFLALVILDGTGTLPHQWYLPQDPDRYRDPAFLVPTSVAFVGVMSTVTFWMLFLGDEMRRERDVALAANEELVKKQEEIRRLNEELEAKVEERTRVLLFRAEHDQLTGLLNRGAASRRCRELLALARRGQRPLTVIIADGDGFKACNDTGGHGYGDKVLRALAGCLRESCRESDVVGRLGGDEFMIVLPDTPVSGAARFCRRVIRRMEDLRERWDAELALPSVSLGLAVFPDHGSSAEALIRVADKAMYDAKAAGGGCWKAGATGEPFAEGAGVRVAEG